MIVGAIGPVHTLMFSRRIIPTSGSWHSIAACALGGMVLLAMAVALSARSVFLWNWAGNSDRVLHTFVFFYVAAGIIYHYSAELAFLRRKRGCVQRFIRTYGVFRAVVLKATGGRPLGRRPTPPVHRVPRRDLPS